MTFVFNPLKLYLKLHYFFDTHEKLSIIRIRCMTLVLKNPIVLNKIFNMSTSEDIYHIWTSYIRYQQYYYNFLSFSILN